MWLPLRLCGTQIPPSPALFLLPQRVVSLRVVSPDCDVKAVPEAVHVVWCETWERVFGGQRDTVMLGAFRCPRKAREAVLEEASEEYHQAIERQVETGG